MFRGTTPTLYFKIHSKDELDTIDDVWVTLKGIGTNSNFSLTKTLKKDTQDVKLDAENKIISLDLTQEETKSFKGNEIQVQLKFKFKDDKVCASTIYKLQVSSPLNEDIMD